MAQFNRKVSRVRRHDRIRKTLSGNEARPRLAVYRSLAHIYAQVIDDKKGVTLASASSLDEDIKKQAEDKKKADVAGLVGAMVAKRAVEKGVSEVAFDRGGFRYHGRVKALGEAARKSGLKF